MLAALYTYGPEAFEDFESLVVEQLRSGFQMEMITRACRPDAVLRNLAHSARAAVVRPRGEPLTRTANRTDALRDTLAARAFGNREVDQVSHPGLTTVITATDLRTGNAVRFGSARSACSVYGSIVEPVRVADAVAASAAFPLLLPAVERAYSFRSGVNAAQERHVVLLTDGGVYDNLGLSVLEPGRSPVHTPHTYQLDYIIACDAGRGRLPLSSGHFAGALEAVVRRRAPACSRHGPRAPSRSGGGRVDRRIRPRLPGNARQSPTRSDVRPSASRARA